MEKEIFFHRNNKGSYNMFNYNMKEFKANKYILLRLEGIYTQMYVNNERFVGCARLILNISKKEVDSFDEIESIDEASELSDHYLIDNEIYKEEHGKLAFSPYSYDIPPETEFWGHCSNIQAWIENDYNTCILHSNIAFPLLKELTKAGDPKAKRVFKEEIAKRMSSGYYPTIKYLILEGYLFFLTIEELLCTINVCKEKLDYPHYIKLIYEILEKWADIMYSSEDIHKRIFIRESMIKIFLGQLLDTKIHKYFEEFIDGIYDRLNEDLMYILHDYRSACIGLCYDYSEAGMYDKLQQHCTFLLSQDTKSSYIWEHLGIAYRNKGLTIYANAAENICQIKEKLKIKGIKKMLRKFKIKQFFWRHFFRFFTLNFWSIKKYHKWSVKKA